MGFFPIGAVVCERVYDQVSEQPIKPVGKKTSYGAIAQLGERLPCTQEVGGSIPPGSTRIISTFKQVITYLHVYVL